MQELIKNVNHCVGCHSCASICPQNCIEMLSDEEGFYYPIINKTKCIECGLCEKVCPVILKNKTNNTPTSYAVLNRDDEMRKNSSSGGFFCLLAENIIDKGGVVFGAAFDTDFNVIHKFVEAKEDLWQLRGSKYVQSNIGETYKEAKEFLDNDRWVLFTGTPCQIEGLLSFLRKDYEKLMTQDIICHGVPSPKVWQEYLKFRKKSDGSTPKSISFRDKTTGWKTYSVRWTYDNNQNYFKKSNADPMMRAFLTNSCLRNSCYDCAFKTLERPSDFTIADYWGIEKIHPELDDDKGVSLVLVNSKKGRELFRDISDKIIFKETDLNLAIKYNTSAINSCKKPKHRKKFVKKINNNNFERIVNEYCSGTLKGKIYTEIKKLKLLILKSKG